MAKTIVAQSAAPRSVSLSDKEFARVCDEASVAGEMCALNLLRQLALNTIEQHPLLTKEDNLQCFLEAVINTLEKFSDAAFSMSFN